MSGERGGGETFSFVICVVLLTRVSGSVVVAGDYCKFIE